MEDGADLLLFFYGVAVFVIGFLEIRGIRIVSFPGNIDSDVFMKVWMWPYFLRGNRIRYLLGLRRVGQRVTFSNAVEVHHGNSA